MANEELVKHFECDCTGEIMRVQHDEDDKSVYVAIYNYGYYNETWSFWAKLKYCFRLMRGRSLWADQIILSQDQAEKLGNFLLKK